MPCMTAVVLERLLDPSSGRSDRDSSESKKKPLSARLRLSLFSPPAPPPLPLPEFPLVEGGLPVGRRERAKESGRLDALRRGEEGSNELERSDLDGGLGKDDDDDDFLSPRETMSVTSCCSGESSAGFGNRTPNQTEFYDAVEDFISDGSVSPSPPFIMKNENELHSLRLDLIEEIERRKTAEMALQQMQNQWQRLAVNLRKVGVSFPAIQRAGGVQFNIDPAAICQEILYTRLVSEAIERGLAQVETEAATEAVIDAKKHEIFRLRDRLHYYEVVSREMVLRNQEIADLALKKHARRRRRWIWGCIGLSVTLGVSLFASTYLEYTVDLISWSHHHDHDHDHAETC